MKKLVTLICIIFISINAFSQAIENVDFNFIDNKIVIYYDLLDCDSKYSYEVDIRFVDDQGNTIIPRNLTGDYGKVSCGRKKIVEWDFFSEIITFEGNYKALIEIVDIYDNKSGKIIKASDIMRITSINGVGNFIYANINQGLEVGSIYYVFSSEGIRNSSGDAIKKVGKIIVKESDYRSSKGIFKLNNMLAPGAVESNLHTLTLDKFKRFDIGIYAGYLGGNEYYSSLSFGLYMDSKFLDNQVLLGLCLGFNTSTKIDLIFSLGVTPFLLNSKFFSLGIDVQPIALSKRYDYEDDYDLNYYGPRLGLYGGAEHKRFKIKSGLGFFNYRHNMSNYAYEDVFLYYSLGLKFRVN